MAGTRKPEKHGKRVLNTNRRALVFECFEYTRAHTSTCLVILGAIVPEPVPLLIGGQSYPVGTRFWEMGSKRTSAGFETLYFDAFAPMEYVGQYTNLDGTVALFKQGPLPEGGFFAWHPHDDGLMWGTDSCSGRIISMDQVRLAERRAA
jgi:hypothetical protein